jgi:hypothetical protein
MNRMSHGTSLFFRILIVLTVVCAPVFGRATTVATPTFSLVAGSYTGTQSVTISDATSGATCHYTLTTKGSTPTTSSTEYSSSISVTATSVLEALCTHSGDTNSSVATAAYTIVAPTPTFSLVGGSYFGSQTVSIGDTNSAATIYYTTNGNAPTTSSTQYTGSIKVSSTETLEAMAVVTGCSNSNTATATYTITTTPGTLSIYLSPPGAQSTTVSGALTETFDTLTASTTPYTTAYISKAGIGTYTGSSADPYAIVAPNVYGGATDSTSSTPTNYFAVGTESTSENPVTLALTQPVSYFGFWWSAGDAYNRVALYSGSSLYGTFSTADLLSFLNNGSGTITATNGTSYQTSAYFGNPNYSSGSNDGTEPFAYVSFAITGATITQIVFYNDSTSTGFESDNHSAIFTGNTVTIPTTFVPVETLTLGSQVVTPVLTPNYNVAPMTVTISTSTAGASINYTTNGTAPTSTTGTAYSGPITVSATETIEAIAYETGMTTSSVASAKYTIPTLAVTSSKNPSTYGGSVTFTATISSGPTGTVTFYDGGTSIGTGTISGTTATFTTASLAVGSHTITASWFGNSTYGSVLSSAITQTVSQAALTITASSPTVTYGAAVPTITPSYSGWVNGQSSSSLTTQPTCTTAYTPTSAAGSSPSTSCSGAVDTNYSISYVAGTVTVNQAALTLSVASSNNPSTYGSSVTFTATISNGPTGTITFYDGGTSIGTGTISGATATFATTSLTAGFHSISAGWGAIPTTVSPHPAPSPRR